jgi:DNA-binding GntR family transcriptional regulator
MALKQISYEPLHQKACDELREALKTGRFRPGQAVTIRGLGKELGISSTPVREALQRLIAEHALALLPNRTVVVPILTRDRFLEITEVRVRLEGLASQEATKFITDRTVAQLKLHESAMGTALREQAFDLYLEHNEKFHFTLYEQCRMPFLLQMIEMTWLQIGPWLNELASEGQFQAGGNKLHSAIVRFAAARDAAAVARAVQQDISEAASHLVRHLPAVEIPRKAVATARGRQRDLRSPDR